MQIECSGRLARLISTLSLLPPPPPLCISMCLGVCLFYSELSTVIPSFTSDPPIIFDTSLKRTATMKGYNAEMKCLAEANPPVVAFEWFYNETLLTNSTTHIINNYARNESITTGMLIIKEVNRRDYGTYTCRATTVVGNFTTMMNFTESCEYTFSLF